MSLKESTDSLFELQAKFHLLCKRLIINAGIKEVVIRTGEKKYITVDVNDWIENDDSLFVL